MKTRRDNEERKKFVKKRKKGVDKETGQWYYKQARLRAPNLENDTEERNARTTVNNLSEASLSKIRSVNRN